MFFSKDRKRELSEIKDVLEEEEMPAAMPAAPSPSPLVRMKEKESAAPLFVKVDKYRDIITSIQEMKLYVSSTKQVFSVLQEIESMRSDALNVLRATLQRLERSVIEMDAELLRPQGVSITAQESSEVTHIESSLGELQKQLLDLKRELQGMK
ncbi:MAG: hypothetical protein HY517_03195 [Candidatus Aenigmarchaeota archaeon]|nr:hypothetical protein [Candidatus Aenigmarchaeota archaeon]